MKIGVVWGLPNRGRSRCPELTHFCLPSRINTLTPTGTSRQHCCRFCCMGAPAHCSDSFLHGAQSLCRRCNFSAGPEATACARVFQLDVARDPQPGADVHEEGRGGWWAHALALLRGGSAVHGGREWKARLPRRPLGDRRSNMRARIILTGVP